jgi:DNA (cytosine-5)-methyltransferase 1
MELKNFNVVDLFCGLGGASQGLLHFLMESGFTPEWFRERGYRLNLINVNHWTVAIETVERNIAFAMLYNAKVQDVDPTFTLRGERPHLVIAAPECIMHSQARGNRPIKDQSRTTAAWVLDWLDLKPDAIFFENVPEWRNWGKLDANLRPLKEHRGEYFQGFLRAIKQRGYVLRDEVVRCDNYGDATIRKRLFILGMQKEIAHRVGIRAMSFPEPTHTATPEKHPNRKPRRVARDIINWNRKGRPITHRPGGPHAVPTLRRVRNGFYKQERLLAPAAVELIDRLIPIAEAFHQEMEAVVTKTKLGRNVTKEESRLNAAIRLRARENAEIAVRNTYALGAGAEPLMRIYTRDLTPEQLLAVEAVTLGQHGGATAHKSSEPIATVAMKGAIGLYVPAQPFIVKANASDSSSFGDAVQSVDAPMNTIVTKDCRALAEPVIAQLYSSNVETGGTDSVDEPLSTITAGGVHQALAEPFIANIYGEREQGDGRTQEIDTPLSTITAGGKHHALAEPTIISHHASRRGESRAHNLDTPVPTATASGAGYLAEPILAVVQHGKDDDRQPSLDDPLPTITSKGSTGIAEPFIVPQDGRCDDTRSVDEPTPTATTIARIGLAEAIVTLAEGFVTPNFGERTSQEPPVHPLDEPLPAITSHGAGMLTVPTVTLPDDGPYVLIDDVPYSFNILYRMLHSVELAAAHSLENVKLPDCEQDAVKLVGNSIPKRTAAALIGHVLTPILRELEALELAA